MSGFCVAVSLGDALGTSLSKMDSLTSLRAKVEAQYKKMALGRSANRMGKRGIRSKVRPTVV